MKRIFVDTSVWDALADKKDTDCTSYVVMKEFGITEGILHLTIILNKWDLSFCLLTADL
jgi:hypothetical protein